MLLYLDFWKCYNELWSEDYQSFEKKKKVKQQGRSSADSSKRIPGNNDY